MSRRPTIGILTSGGDCPGLNAVIRAATKSAIRLGYDVVGFLTDIEQLQITPDQMARVVIDDRPITYAVTRAGLQPLATNWPRALHEGNWHALWGSGLNLALSLVLAGLWGTGLVIWAKRRFRKRNPRARLAAA
jgi:hypothetical protein